MSPETVETLQEIAVNVDAISSVLYCGLVVIIFLLGYLAGK